MILGLYLSVQREKDGIIFIFYSDVFVDFAVVLAYTREFKIYDATAKKTSQISHN